MHYNQLYIYILLTADNGTSRMRTTHYRHLSYLGGSIRIAYTSIHTHSQHITIHSSTRLYCIVIEARPLFNFTSLLLYVLLLFLFSDLLEKVKKGIQVPIQQTLGRVTPNNP